MNLHWCVRTECAPGERDRYFAYCGYESADAKEFVTNPNDPHRVRCEKCKEYDKVDTVAFLNEMKGKTS